LSLSLRVLLPPPPLSTLFPYTTLFRSYSRWAPRMSSFSIRARHSQNSGVQFPSSSLLRCVTLCSYCLLFWVFRSLCSLCRCSKRSEEHTSELQSRFDLVCRLLLEKKNNVGVM